MTSQHASALIGRSVAVADLRTRIERIARSPVAVLIVGETGTGKEVCAEEIVRLSGRSPFRPVNCSAIAENLVESELFGHTRGAFTGAIRDHEGVIATANGGVLFLDELAEIPPPVQAKLLRTLESGEYQPVGSKLVCRSTFRIVAAVNEDPDRLVAAGRLRVDLLHRLGSVRLWLAPLRERLEDIPLLVEAFVRRFLARMGQPAIALTDDAMAFLMRQPWPGNVRQLRNVVEAAVAMAGSEPLVTAAHVREVLGAPEVAEPGPVRTRSMAESLRRAAVLAIRKALLVTGGNRDAAAKLLRISPATLYRKMAEKPAADRGEASQD